MASYDHYRANLRDIEFNLFEYLRVDTTSLAPGKTELDEAAARHLIEGALRACTEDLAPAYITAEETPLSLNRETGNVTIPPSMRQAYRAYFDAGIGALSLPTALGGLGAPPSIAWAIFELVVGANQPLALYLLGNVIAPIISELATPEQVKRFVKPLVEHNWGGTMVLTEADAGSDVGAGRTTAVQVQGDLWSLSGVKRFITAGDFDAVDNIVHLVLARPEGGAPGTKGLSLFIVPKFLVNDDGSLGERNGVYCTKIEDKMGLSASATCELTFGERGKALGWLVGNVHDGMRQMFRVIQHARMAVGIKSLATVSSAYFHALAFARERVQGANLLAAKDPKAPRVPIIQHPDVRRMLLAQKAHAEGMRALAYFNAAVQDIVELKGGHSNAAAAEEHALNDLLLPIIKGYCSEKGYELLSLALQTFGGSGYLRDYPIEQYIRDQKIDTLYEGTTHIQALDLLARKLPKSGGMALMKLTERIDELVAKGPPELAEERIRLGAALAAVRASLGALMEKSSESPYYLGLLGNRLLFAIAEVIIGWLLLDHARLALTKLPQAKGTDKHFYEGKVASARYFSREVLPSIESLPAFVQRATLWPMELPDEAFGG